MKNNIKNYTLSSLFLIAALLPLALPYISYAAVFNLVPCDGVGSSNNTNSVSAGQPIAAFYTLIYGSNLPFTITPNQISLASGAPSDDSKGTVQHISGSFTYSGSNLSDGSGNIIVQSGQTLSTSDQITLSYQSSVSAASAQQIIDSDSKTTACNLPALVTLIKNVINALIVIAIPLTTVALTWVGILLLTAQGNVGKIEEAKRIAKSVIIGFIFVLTAWLIVHTIVTIFLQPEFNQYLK